MDNLTRRSGRVGSGKVGLGLKIYKNMQVWLGRVEKSQKRSEGQVVVSIQQELVNYKTLKVPPAFRNPLQFWQQQTTEYTIMSATARRVLCISASSAQSERDFSSSVGSTITDMRSRLNEETVEAVEFLQWGTRAGLIIE